MPTQDEEIARNLRGRHRLRGHLVFPSLESDLGGHGHPTAIEDGACLLAHLDALTEIHEADQPIPWKVSEAPPEFTHRLVRSSSPRWRRGKVRASGCIVVLLGCGSLVSCLPIPNMHYFAPAIRGVITREGAPVENVEVIVSSPFTSALSTARTDSLGRYDVAALKEARLFVVVLGDPLYDYRMDIHVAGRRYPGAHDVRIGDAPRELRLNCELAHAATDRGEQAYCSHAGSSPRQAR